jgi:hypothetical protein
MSVSRQIVAVSFLSLSLLTGCRNTLESVSTDPEITQSGRTLNPVTYSGQDAAPSPAGSQSPQQPQLSPAARHPAAPDTNEPIRLEQEIYGFD